MPPKVMEKWSNQIEYHCYKSFAKMRSVLMCHYYLIVGIDKVIYGFPKVFRLQ